MGISGHFLFCLISPFVLSFTKLTVVSAFSVFENGHVDPSNCTLQPETERMKREFKDKIEQGNRLIKLDITVQWNLSRPNDSYPNKMLWFFTMSAAETNLLLLDENFIGMSLGFLSYRNTDLSISLVQKPGDCLRNLTANDADKLLKFSLLDFSKSQKAVNEEKVNTLYLCTGFVESNRSCCSLSSTSGDIKCHKLLDDKWMNNFRTVIGILAIILMSHSIYLIPSFVYEEDQDSSYQLVDKDLKLCVKVSREPIPDTISLKIEKSPIIKAICDKIDTSKENATFDLFIQSVKRMDSEFVSVLSKSNLLQSLYSSFEDIAFRCDLYKRKCLNAVFKIFVIIFCTSPITLRTVLSYKIYSFIPPYVYYALTIIFISFVVMCTFLPFPIHKLIRISLRRFHYVNNFENKTNTIVYYLCLPFQKRCFWDSFFGLPLSIGKGILWCVLVFLIPVVLFLYIYIDESVKYKKSDGSSLRQVTAFAICFTLCSCCGLILITFCAIFYIECIAYILIGLFMNYKQVIDTILIVLMVLIYICQLLHDVYKKIDSFNQTVLRLLFELSETPGEQLLENALKAKTNTAMAFTLRRNQERVKHIEICINEIAKPFLLVDGIYLFYKFEKLGNMPYLYISQTFFDDLASKPGFFTPGRKLTLLLKACREVFSLFLALLALSFIIQRFSRTNGISALVHTVVTAGSGIALATLNRLLFRSFDNSLIGQDLYLKEQIIRHLEDVKDVWFDAEFDCSAVDRQYESESESEILVTTDDRGSISGFYLKFNNFDHDNDDLGETSS